MEAKCECSGKPWRALADTCPLPDFETSKQQKSFFSLSLLQNPSPGLFAVMHPLTYAETLIDYHLCSHPKYKFTKESHSGSSIPLTQKQFLHHTVIPSPSSLADWPWTTGEGREQGWGVTAGTETKKVCSHSCRTRMVMTMAVYTLVPPALQRCRWETQRHSGAVHTHLPGCRSPFYNILTHVFPWRLHLIFILFLFQPCKNSHMAGITPWSDLLFLYPQKV